MLPCCPKYANPAYLFTRNCNALSGMSFVAPGKGTSLMTLRAGCTGPLLSPYMSSAITRLLSVNPTPRLALGRVDRLVSKHDEVGVFPEVTSSGVRNTSGAPGAVRDIERPLLYHQLGSLRIEGLCSRRNISCADRKIASKWMYYSTYYSGWLSLPKTPASECKKPKARMRCASPATKPQTSNTRPSNLCNCRIYRSAAFRRTSMY